jgi:hypothetical protein
LTVSNAAVRVLFVIEVTPALWERVNDDWVLNLSRLAWSSLRAVISEIGIRRVANLMLERHGTKPLARL